MPSTDYVLITGVSGFVGDHLARHFAAQGRQVAGTFLSTPISIPKVSCVPLDAADPLAVQRLIRDMRPAAVVHCAAATNASWCQAHQAEARRAIVDATRNLCDAVRERAPETPFISFSTDLVFDGESAPYAEDAEPKPLNVYGSLKAETEALVQALPRGVVLRAALVYGPPATIRTSFLSWMVKSLVDWEDLTLFEDEWRTAVLIDDLAQAVDLLLQNNGTLTGRVFHAGGPDRLSRVQMGEQLAEVFGLPADPIVPTRRADVAGASIRARDTSLLCDRLLQLGWKQTPFLEGLARCRERWTALQSA